LLRLFKEFRELERDLEWGKAVKDSMGRYIEALEGRDGERVDRIKELEVKYREALAVIRDMRTRLAGLCPDRKEEKP
jgi:hypothetical protein